MYILGVTTTLHGLFGSTTDAQADPELGLSMALIRDFLLGPVARPHDYGTLRYITFRPKKPQIRDTWPIFAACGPPNPGLPASRLWVYYQGSYHG
jgi:hypothetical protein